MLLDSLDFHRGQVIVHQVRTVTNKALNNLSNLIIRPHHFKRLVLHL